MMQQYGRWFVVGIGLSALSIAWAVGAEPSPSATPATPVDSTTLDAQRVSVAVARDRARVMHEIYLTTLDVIHDRYFHGDRAIIPARAMEDVFAQMKEQSAVEARWISVNLPPMSLSHEPKTPFEKRAAEELATGKPTYEVVEDGYYRHAGAILLTDGCVNCHGGFFKQHSKSPKFAGLVINIPVRREAAANAAATGK